MMKMGKHWTSSMKKSLIWSRLDLAPRQGRFLWKAACKSTQIYGWDSQTSLGTFGCIFWQTAFHVVHVVNIWRRKVFHYIPLESRREIIILLFCSSHAYTLIRIWTFLFVEKVCDVPPEESHSFMAVILKRYFRYIKTWYSFWDRKSMSRKDEMWCICNKVRLLALKIKIIFIEL